MAGMVLKSDIDRCPKKSMLPAHYRVDGSCRCDEHQSALRELVWAEEAHRRTAQKLRNIRKWVKET